MEIINQFAIKHKIKWGRDKCKVMRVGKHTKDVYKWNIGDMEIDETEHYKYLGDIVSSDGRNKENIKSRQAKLQASIISVNTYASNEVMARIEAPVLLDLYETIAISGFMTNAESWSLNKGEENEIEIVEIQALKNLFDLPIHTPTAAIVYTLGVPFTKQRIDKRTLLFLYKILHKDSEKWMSRTLLTLDTLNIGWCKKIKETLAEYDLPLDFDEIKSHSLPQWTKRISIALETKHKERLLEMCYKNENGLCTPKTKTAHLIDKLNKDDYKRQPEKEIMKMTKLEAKTVITARYRMLECGKNHKGTLSLECTTCNIIDDENHRLNDCPKWQHRNIHNSKEHERIDFNKIFSNDICILREIIPVIQNLWNVKTAHGTMYRD